MADFNNIQVKIKVNKEVIEKARVALQARMLASIEQHMLDYRRMDWQYYVPEAPTPDPMYENVMSAFESLLPKPTVDRTQEPEVRYIYDLSIPSEPYRNFYLSKGEQNDLVHRVGGGEAGGGKIARLLQDSHIGTPMTGRTPASEASETVFYYYARTGRTPKVLHIAESNFDISLCFLEVEKFAPLPTSLPFPNIARCTECFEKYEATYDL